MLAIVVHRDVTALRLLEQTKEDYLALISHDLRAPLTAVQAEAQLLERQLARDGNVDSAYVKRTTSIVANARRMNAMIQELLESSLLESGTDGGSSLGRWSSSRCSGASSIGWALNACACKCRRHSRRTGRSWSPLTPSASSAC